MKKENKQKKREAEQEAEREEKDRQFKRQGNICLAVIVVCFVLMLIVGRLNDERHHRRGVPLFPAQRRPPPQGDARGKPPARIKSQKIA